MERYAIGFIEQESVNINMTIVVKTVLVKFRLCLVLVNLAKDACLPKKAG